MEKNCAGEKVFYADYTWSEMDSLDRRNVVVVLPSGSLEQHGPHLTMASDSTAAEAVSLRAAKQVSGVLVMPCLHYVPCLDTSNYTGTISISSSAFVDYVCEIILSLHRHGFRKLVIANVHGGAKTALDVAIREFHARMGTAEKAYADDFFIHLHNIYNTAIPLLNEMCEGEDWGHACEMETRLVLAIEPELVRMDRIPDEPAVPLGRMRDLPPTHTGIAWYSDYPDHYAGDARPATRAKGQTLLRLASEYLAQYIAAVKADQMVPALMAEFFQRAEDIGRE